MMRDMFGNIVTHTEKRCETCNEVTETIYSNGDIGSCRSCKCTKEFLRKIQDNLKNGKPPEIRIHGEGFFGSLPQRNYEVSPD